MVSNVNVYEALSNSDHKTATFDVCCNAETVTRKSQHYAHQ